MTSRSFLLAVALAFTFAGCNCVAPSQTVSYSCEGGEACPPDQQCCADQHCRTSCDVVPAGCSPACAQGFECTDAGTCVDLRCQAVTCAAGQQCVEGQCVCTPGGTCTTNAGAPCLLGEVTCLAGQASCGDGPAAPDGVGCSDAGVCVAGACVACTDGLPCAQNPSGCLRGRLACSSVGLPTCNDTTSPRPAGSGCGVDLVCDGDGGCGRCVSGESCQSKTDCRRGAISCGSGVPNCEDVGALDAGAPCDGGVCSPSAVCLPCAEGSSCSGNPSVCRQGIRVCSGWLSTCADGPRLAPGTSCGTNLYCVADGGCVSCLGGQACTNPGRCRVGQTVCDAGVSTCQDTPAVLPAGTPCGVSQVCNGAAVCTACTAGGSCNTNPEQCRYGVISCSTGAPMCIDGPMAKPPSSTCATGASTCNGVGQCGPCVNDGVCSTNPNPCKKGLSKCGPPSLCVDDVALTAGTACGTSRVCDGAGGCVSCVPGAPCSPSPTLCKVGVIDCSGTPRCVAGPSQADGTICDTDAGNWSACSATASSPCSTVGYRTRTYFDSFCFAGQCHQQAAAIVQEACTVTPNPEGTTCAPSIPSGPPGPCAAADVCTTVGAQSQKMTAYVCAGGACTPIDGGQQSAPCPATATGCYSGMTCRTGTEWNACGTGGEACVSCRSVGACIAQSCIL